MREMDLELGAVCFAPFGLQLRLLWRLRRLRVEQLLDILLHVLQEILKHAELRSLGLAQTVLVILTRGALGVGTVAAALFFLATFVAQVFTMAGAASVGCTLGLALVKVAVVQLVTKDAAADFVKLVA